jgi:hypothetical protein
MRAEQDTKGKIFLVKSERVADNSGWSMSYSLRIVVPKATLQEHTDLLIFKSYAEIMGLPYEILEEEVHFYCNEILPQHQPIIDNLGLTVQNK